MAHIFLLGPSVWESGKSAPPGQTPMQVRRRVADIFRRDGHKALLMEDAPEVKGEDMIQRFDRLLRQDITDVVVYWPPCAKMQTTYDELILLCDRRDLLNQKRIDIWVLHHTSVASIRGEEFNVLESGNRSRYLTAVAKLGVHPLEWEGDKQLMDRVRLLSTQLAP